MRWFETYRLNWIKEQLDVYGFINRIHLMRKFDVSIAQAALDFQSFQQQFPDYMRYDRSLKRYVKVDFIKEEDDG